MLSQSLFDFTNEVTSDFHRAGGEGTFRKSFLDFHLWGSGKGTSPTPDAEILKFTELLFGEIPFQAMGTGKRVTFVGH